MGRILASLLGLLGIAQPPPPPEGDIRMVDPRTLYFSMSTIADELPPLEPVADGRIPADLIMHEDEWRQIEFFPASRLAEIQAMMEQLVAFEAANREGEVFREIFVRRLPASLVLSGPDAIPVLARDLGTDVGPGPVLRTTRSVTGQVASGFTLALPGKVLLYGQRGSRGILALGAVVGHGGDHESLTRAFMTLSAKHGLIAVDWRSHMILVGTSPDGAVEVWRPDGE